MSKAQEDGSTKIPSKANEFDLHESPAHGSVSEPAGDGDDYTYEPIKH